MTRKPALLEALADVRELRRAVIERQLFRGYSGYARILGGCIALVAAGGLAIRGSNDLADHVLVWGTVCALSTAINGAALLFWWRQRQEAWEGLRPVADLIAPFTVGALLTFSLLAYSLHDLLFPSWMWIFGLMNISARHTMPRTFAYLGWYYIAAGTACLMLPRPIFINPLPMGAVFFAGECVGGVALIQLRKEE